MVSSSLVSSVVLALGCEIIGNTLMINNSLTYLKLDYNRLTMKTTLETSEDENYTRNELRWKLHPKRVKMKTTPETSEDMKRFGSAGLEQLSVGLARNKTLR